MYTCKICSGSFIDSPDNVILCDHKEGMAHLGCCVHNCSMNGKPCVHCKSTYTKVN